MSLRLAARVRSAICRLRPTPGRLRLHTPFSQARAAESAKSSPGPELPQRLVIFHAGTGPITFLAMLKASTLFLGLFFGLVVVPAHLRSNKPPLQTALIAVCGAIPFLFVAYTTSPFVTHIQIHLPPSARSSPLFLHRFVRSMPPSTRLTLTTLSVIGKPRHSILEASQLRPARRRFGIVNFIRQPVQESHLRSQHKAPSVSQFFIKETKADEDPTSSITHLGRSAVYPWIWHNLKLKLAEWQTSSRSHL